MAKSIFYNIFAWRRAKIFSYRSRSEHALARRTARRRWSRRSAGSCQISRCWSRQTSPAGTDGTAAWARCSLSCCRVATSLRRWRTRSGEWWQCSSSARPRRTCPTPCNCASKQNVAVSLIQSAVSIERGSWRRDNVPLHIPGADPGFGEEVRERVLGQKYASGVQGHPLDYPR